MNPLIKENLCQKSENNVEWCSKKQGKMISTDVRANVKQQQKTRKEPVHSHMWLYHINKKGVYFI